MQYLLRLLDDGRWKPVPVYNSRGQLQRPSWLLTSQATEALDAIYDACGPIELSESDWERLLGWADHFWVGGVVGLMWVRDHHQP